ncbi:hypothetical protein [Salinispora tropica]|uniref:LppX_LprAFG lipoprotein n=1 Tax=Salinispora tropica (strain ATCC BAA-916 / DSM 44818 / JCM 13857 / NBRC 105044 / CNB-440) TaxID=369723 RepID=A4XBT6_SALTO|nr:hypothetical protein [Salinispora tropica]ABP56393.1 hypothetical protein Strop_3963 [Salinispora tropica CNB-440]
MSRWKNIAVLAAATASVVAGTGCGPSTASQEAAQQSSVLELLANDLKGSLQEAADRTSKVETVRATMVATGGPEEFEMQIAMDLRDSVSVEMVMATQGEVTTIRLIDSVMYMEIPETVRERNDGKRWMEMDFSAASGTGLDEQIRDADPVQQVKTLLELEGVTVVGEETVGGVPTVHYSVTVTTEEHLALLEKQGELDSASLANAEDQLAEFGVAEIQTELWIDEQYWPRRARVTMGEMGLMTVDYTDYNEPVTIETPPAAETTDFAELLGDLGEELATTT